MVGPTGVEKNIATSIPVSAHITEIIADAITVRLKVLTIRIAESAGKMTSADIRSEPTRFIARTIIIAVMTAIKRL